nr:hypothetical protein B0A51_18108 [Rachicladosporium sp. CCFEE 5018]
MGVKQLNGRQARWATFLASFDFAIEHRSGKSNPADAPSRRPDYAGESQAVPYLLPILQNKLAVWETSSDLAPIIGRVRAGQQDDQMRAAGDEPYAVMIRAVVNAAARGEDPFGGPADDLASLIGVLQRSDSELPALRERLAGDEHAWREANGLWYYNDALYVPEDSAMRAELMRIHHDDELAGHFGRDKTEKLLRRKYWWPSLAKDVEERVATCSNCEYMKARRHRPYGDAQALRMPNRPWQELSMDMITDLPPSVHDGQKYDAILVIVDRYTKMNLYAPTTKRCTSVELAQILMERVVRHPFELLYSWHPDIRDPIRDESREERVPAAAERARSMRSAHAALAERWRVAQESQKMYQNKRQKPMTFKVGDKVLLSTKNLRLQGERKKLSAKYVGPFRIRDAVGPQAYRLALPTSYIIHDVFHVSLLEPWRQRAGEQPAEPMPLAEHDDEWEVEAIQGSKKWKGKQWYLVQWKGWPEEYTSWEPKEHCVGAEQLIGAWEAQAESTRSTRAKRKKW